MFKSISRGISMLIIAVLASGLVAVPRANAMSDAVKILGGAAVGYYIGKNQGQHHHSTRQIYRANAHQSRTVRHRRHVRHHTKYNRYH